MPDYYKGSLFLIQVGSGGGGETFTTVACARSTSFSLNSEQIDVTSKCTMPWKTLIEGGIRSASASFSGIFNNDATLATMITKARDGVISNFKLVSARGDSFTGAFQVTSMERSGEYNDAEQYSFSLESSGAITFTPAA